MKTLRSILAILLAAGTIYGAAVCFDIPGPHVGRVAEAFGSVLNLTDANGSPRPATQQEVSNAVQAYVQATTQDYERRKNMAAFSPSPVPITATPIPSATP